MKLCWSSGKLCLFSLFSKWVCLLTEHSSPKQHNAPLIMGEKRKTWETQIWCPVCSISCFKMYFLNITNCSFNCTGGAWYRASQSHRHGHLGGIYRLWWKANNQSEHPGRRKHLHMMLRIFFFLNGGANCCLREIKLALRKKIKNNKIQMRPHNIMSQINNKKKVLKEGIPLPRMHNPLNL